jgi:hypothetical protein
MSPLSLTACSPRPIPRGSGSPVRRYGRQPAAFPASRNVLLLLDQLTENVGEARQYFMWLPTAIVWVMVVQFLTLIPVALALRRWLPPTPSVQLATAAAIGALLAIAILQLLLVTGALEFDVRVVLVMATFLMIYTWCSRSARRGIAAAACPGRRHASDCCLGRHIRWAL